jgi:hypothetical protein
VAVMAVRQALVLRVVRVVAAATIILVVPALPVKATMAVRAETGFLVAAAARLLLVELPVPVPVRALVVPVILGWTATITRRVVLVVLAARVLSQTRVLRTLVMAVTTI